MIETSAAVSERDWGRLRHDPAIFAPVRRQGDPKVGARFGKRVGLKAAPEGAEDTYMASIKAECPRCGVVRLTPDQVTLRVCTDDGSSAYRFRCPRCEVRVLNDTSRVVAELLGRAGVLREEWQVPAELAEAHQGPPLNADDLLDFHLFLHAAEWPADIATLMPQTDAPGS
jgi:hypothetical protein